MSRRGFYWSLVAATLVVYGAIVLWSLPLVSSAAGGLAPFDMRPGGYSPDEARAFLTALDEAGRAQYLGPQRLLDTAYPAMLATVLGLGLWHLTRGLWRAVLVPVAFAGAAFDYLENIRVRRMLTAAPDAVTDGEVAAASFATLAKSGLTTLAFVALLAAFTLRVWRRRTRQ